MEEATIESVSVAKRIEDFLLDLQTDPSAKILGLDQHGVPMPKDAFRHVPRLKQRIITLRVLIVDEDR